MHAVRVNPPARELGADHAVLWGRGAWRHRVDGFEGPASIKCVLRGEATWTTRHGRYPLRPGSWMVLNEGQRYSLEVNFEEPVETFCVFFRAGFLEEALRPAGGRGVLEVRREDPELLSRLRTLRARLTEPSDALALESAWVEIASEVAGSEARLRGLAVRVPAVRPGTRAELLRRVLRGRDFVEGSLGEPLTLESVAREACISPFHFHRLFRAVTGESLHRYVRERRLVRARGLLLGGDEPVTGIAARVGFESLGSFTTAFTRRYGTSPGRLRASTRG